MPSVRFLIVTTPSRLALETVKKILSMLQQLAVPIIGVIENMRRSPSSLVKNQLATFNVPLIGEIDFDDSLEQATGSTNDLLHTPFAADLRALIRHAQDNHLL